MTVDLEVIHSSLECDLCGEEDYCVEATGANRVIVCSRCVAHMSRLYDDLERDYPSYGLRRHEAQP